MSFTDKKTKSTQDSSGTFSQTSTPNVPTWISDPAQAMAGQVGKLQAQGPSAFTPTTSSLENQVTAGAANFTPSSNYSDATGAFNNIPQVEGQSLLTNLSDYYNPFKEQITNPVMNDFDFQAGQTRAAQAAQAAQGKAFQGSRYGIQEGETEGALARARAATEGGLLSNMFTESTGLSSQDAARRQAAMEANQGAGVAKAQGLAGIDTAKNAQQLQEQAAQAAIAQRATEEQQIQQQYPLTFAAQTEGLLSGLNPALYTGSTTSGTTTGHSTGTTVVSDPIGQAANLMAGVGGLFKGLGGIPGG
jgi:hypothetical protein